jgi:hypothetical protein
MRSRHGLLATFAIAGALSCVSCGSGNDDARRPSAGAGDVKIIREWSQALTAGDLGKAASYFAVPAIIENGTPPVRIHQPRAGAPVQPTAAMRRTVGRNRTLRLTPTPRSYSRTGLASTAARAPARSPQPRS